MAEKISVIVPAYNNAPWLGRCLDSLLSQTYEHMEILVVNDGSTDDTGAVLDRYAQQDQRIKAIRKENGGVTSARLRGVAEATGDWLGFVDGDDVVEPQMYERLLHNAHAYGADISHCGQQLLFPDGRVTMVSSSGEIREQDHITGLRDLLDGGLIESGLCTKLYKRELFSGLEDWMDRSIKNNEDLLMNFYLFDRAKSAVFEAVCPYHYILRQGSASYGTLNSRMIFDPIRVRQIILETCQPEIRPDARQALLRNCLFGYAQLTMERGHDFDDDKNTVRRMLAEQRQWFSLLSTRNRVLAEMICRAPWSFRFAYRLFVALFQREEQH